MGSAPVGVQCPLTSSLGEFPGYWAGSGILGFRPCWCPLPFPSTSISRCFSIRSSSLAIGFHSSICNGDGICTPPPTLLLYSSLGLAQGHNGPWARVQPQKLNIKYIHVHIYMYVLNIYLIYLNDRLQSVIKVESVTERCTNWELCIPFEDLLMKCKEFLFNQVCIAGTSSFQCHEL